MKIILTPAEVNRIIVDSLLASGRLKYSNTTPVDVHWDIKAEDVSKSEFVIEQELYEDE